MICNYSTTKWDVGKEVRQLLLSNQDLNKIIKGNIFPIVAPENTDGEFVVYYRENYKREYVKQGIIEDRATVAVIVISDDYDKSIEMAELIDFTLSSTGDYLLVGSEESFEDLKYIQTLHFEIK